MTASEDRLSRNQRLALRAMLEYPTVKLTARETGLSERTIHRYLHDPFFKQCLREEQSAVALTVSSALQEAGAKAVAVLLNIMMSKSASNHEKIRAAQVLLAERSKAVDAELIMERIEELERIVGGAKR